METVKNSLPIEELKRRTEELKKIYPIYPLYNKKIGPVTDSIVKVNLETIVRIEREGVYYLVLCKLEHSIRNIEGYVTAKPMEQVLDIFHTNIYRRLILHKVDFNIVNNEGNPIVCVDTDQRSEEERLAEIIFR